MSGETTFVALDGVAIVGILALIVLPAAVALWRTVRGTGGDRRPE